MNNGIKKIATIGIVLIALLIGTSLLMYQEYEYTHTRESRVKESTRVAEVELNKSIYRALKREAQAKTDRLTLDIRNKLVEEYEGDMEQFAKDYDSPSNNSQLVKIVDTSINSDENRFFHVESDANDMFATSRHRIISDRSEDCGIDDKDRTIEEEIDIHFNKGLAKEAWSSLIKGDKNNIFWRFRNTVGDKKDVIKSMDINKVLELPLEDLKDYEFLTVSYIDKYGDILGVKDVDPMGRKSESRKIMIVQGFNLYEQVEKDFKPSYTKVLKNEKLQLAIIEESRREIATKLFLMIALVLISFILMAIIQDLFAKGCGVNDKSK